MNNIVVFNAESAYYYFSDPVFRDCVLNSDLLFCDSVSLSIALRMIRVSHCRLHGPDFFDAYLRKNQTKKIVIFGGNTVAHERINEKYSLTNTIYFDQQFSGDDLSEQCLFLEKYRPAAVFVCLGLRKQEKFVSGLLHQLGSATPTNLELILGVGAAIDFCGETKPRAGIIFRSLGLEWLPRLVREPRMFPRIIRSIVGCIRILLNRNSVSKELGKFALSFEGYL